jgi:hypothetical protein
MGCIKMMKKMTLDEIDKLIEQLLQAEQLKLAARICERLSGSDMTILMASSSTTKPEKKQIQNYLLEYPKPTES